MRRILRVTPKRLWAAASRRLLDARIARARRQMIPLQRPLWQLRPFHTSGYQQCPRPDDPWMDRLPNRS